MKNAYMFFSKQEFADLNLEGYDKKDINIPQTDIYIYQFQCNNEKEDDDEDKAKKLDELTSIFKEKFPEQFILISSGSSQYFCSVLYPLVMNFETQLRYALYVSRALYNSKEIDVSSFLLEIDKNNKRRIEELDFGKIYEAVFTDKDLQDKIKKLSGEKWSKIDLIKNIQSWKENTMWQGMVGKEYNYIEENFLKIKEFRNHVMHSHLISYDVYYEAKNILTHANEELEKVIENKLIVNESKYLNTVNIMQAIKEGLSAIEKFNEFLTVEIDFRKFLSANLLEQFLKSFSQEAFNNAENPK